MYVWGGSTSEDVVLCFHLAMYKVFSNHMIKIVRGQQENWSKHYFKNYFQTRSYVYLWSADGYSSSALSNALSYFE